MSRVDRRLPRRTRIRSRRCDIELERWVRDRRLELLKKRKWMRERNIADGRSVPSLDMI